MREFMAHEWMAEEQYENFVDPLLSIYETSGKPRAKKKVISALQRKGSGWKSIATVDSDESLGDIARHPFTRHVESEGRVDGGPRLERVLKGAVSFSSFGGLEGGFASNPTPPLLVTVRLFISLALVIIVRILFIFLFFKGFAGCCSVYLYVCICTTFVYRFVFLCCFDVLRVLFLSA